MRFKSSESGPYQIFAVSGVNSLSFGIQADETVRPGLLGFAVERIDPVENERYFMSGFKVFRSVIPLPSPETFVSTWNHPIQSFVWDDFTAKPDREYEYLFYPLKGTPKNLDRSTPPILIRVRTEPLFSNERHDVFFNRGAASSQAYQRRFGNQRPDQLGAQKAAALQWLTRDLDEAILHFIQGAEAGDTLLGCFYEFRYEPVAVALKQAIDRGVKVQLIIDGKINESTDKNGVFRESFPREDNLRMLNQVGIPAEHVILRQARPNDIQHNKFMVLVRSGDRPEAVWTGSTNLSLGGFSGQTNVGHWVRDPQVAQQFVAYWQLLQTDPGSKKGDSRSEAIQANRILRTAVAALDETPVAIDQIPVGTTSVFSPRSGREILDLYIKLVDSAQSCSCITLAFGINEAFKQALLDNTRDNHLVFMLLEKQDRPRSGSQKPFVPLTAANNVYQAWGSYIKDPVYQWARETNARMLNLNVHVAYVHSKFLLMDPLGDEPIVVTGSANFSEASTNDNDENMLLIRGDRRVADIYFTEFNRLFNHYYFRAVRESLGTTERTLRTTSQTGGLEASVFLDETDGWLKKYQPGKLRTKRLQLFTQMKGTQTIS